MYMCSDAERSVAVGHASSILVLICEYIAVIQVVQRIRCWLVCREVGVRFPVADI